MTKKTNVKAGGHNLNHSETFRGGLKLQTRIKAGMGEHPGRLAANHSESMR